VAILPMWPIAAGIPRPVDPTGHDRRRAETGMPAPSGKCRACDTPRPESQWWNVERLPMSGSGVSRASRNVNSALMARSN
jgi:hypothetical protein